ncbi:ermin-like [Hypanus sabinus]|uniref:ermin-like n=1 Tax=Hypanus sabinus TaxID=79690 RepID=UPI0028C3D5FE|nr:ermin-like [Hypanus sabinus]
MAEENSTVSCSAEAEKTITSVHHPEMVDNIKGAVDAIPSTEENIPSDAVSNFLLPENITSSEGAKSTTEENCSLSEEIIADNKTITGTEQTESHSKENCPAPEGIPCNEETCLTIEQVVSTEKEIRYPADEITPCTKEYCLSPDLATQTAQKSDSSAVEAVPIPTQTNFPCEQTLVQETTSSTENINQPTEDMVLTTESAKSFTAETVVPEVTSIQSTGLQSEVTPSSSFIEEGITLPSTLLENSADGERNETVPAVEKAIELSEVCKEKEADQNVINHNTNENGDEIQADEEIDSQEFQESSDLESPSTSPIQPESPTNTDYAEEQSRPSRRPDVTKHSYSRYNTVSYRKIKKGNTKQRIDEFESMLQIN